MTEMSFMIRKSLQLLLVFVCCAAFVAQLAAEGESNLGQIFKVLRSSGWEISAWPVIAKSSIQERIDQGRICD